MQSFVDGINRQIAEIKQDPGHKTPYEFGQWGISAEPWTLVDFLAYIASVPNGRDSYELQNLAFLEAMVARYGENTGRTIFNDVAPITDPDSPTTITSQGGLGSCAADAESRRLPGSSPLFRCWLKRWVAAGRADAIRGKSMSGPLALCVPRADTF